MSKHGYRAVKTCIWTWIAASIIITTGSMDADTMTVMEAIKIECGLTIALGIVILALVILDRGGEHTDRPKLSNVDKAINCLQMDKLDGHKNEEHLKDASRYIALEQAKRRVDQKEAKRLADRKASIQ